MLKNLKFNSYSNFVPSTDFGVPINPNKPDEFARKLDEKDTNNEINDDEASNSSISTRPNGTNTINKTRCWQHIQKLIRNAILEHNQNNTNNNEAKSTISSTILIDENLPIVVCSFSKGCVVLNQLCHEIVEVSKLTVDSSEDIKSLAEFRDKVKHLIWLDGGHSGSSNSWIVDECVVETLKKLDMSCYVYVTPYQMKSPKSWSIDEYEKFIVLLEKFGVTCRKCYYFQEREDDFDIDLHFEILNAFDTNLIVE